MIVNPYKQGKDARRIFNFNKVFGTNATQGMSSLVVNIVLLFLHGRRKAKMFLPGF